MNNSLRKQALMFPGQGSHFAELRTTLNFETPAVGEWLGFVERKTGLALRPIFAGQNLKALEEDQNVQVAVFSYCVALLKNHERAIEERRPQSILPHSMGIYAGLVAAQAIHAEEALFLVQGAADLALSVAREGDYRMGVVLGLSQNEVQSLLDREEAGSVSISCVNTERQMVLAGKQTAIRRFLHQALQHGAFLAKELDIKIPFHTPFLKEIGAEFCKVVQQVSLSDPQIPILSPQDQKWLRNKEDIQVYLNEFLYCPQDWLATLRFLLQEQFQIFVEIGPGDTLTRMLRWVDRGALALNEWLAFSPDDPQLYK